MASAPAEKRKFRIALPGDRSGPSAEPGEAPLLRSLDT